MFKTSRSARENALNLLIIFAMLIIAFGCVCGNENDNRNGLKNSNDSKPVANSSAKKPSKKGDTKSDTTRKSETPDNGDFLVEYVEVQDSRYQKINDNLRQEKVLESAAKDLNKSLALPYDITLVTRDCGQVNAFYNPADHSVTLCYELLDNFYTLFKKSGRGDTEATQDMFDAAQFVFLHELGHALIDAYQLPVTGKEEDSADGLSTYICLEELKENGARSTIAAAELFGLQAQSTSKEDLPFYDEHSLDQQRFYNLLCSLYGKDPDKYETLVTKGLLPKPRAVRCPNEYQQLKKAWTNLLGKYRKQ
ncbi:MAG: DUF4344 domain-containing metallopeptidase [Pyrinomonadaceae bacterium]